MTKGFDSDFICRNFDRAEVSRRFKEHYTKSEILYEIVKYSNSREISMFGDGRVRGIMAHKVNYLLANFKAFDCGRKLYNLYMSIAKLNGLGMLSFSPPIRKKQMVELNDRFQFISYAYDLGYDFDCKKYLEKAHTDCSTLKQQLDFHKIEYFLKFSGGGFHIRIPNSEIMKIYPNKKCFDVVKVAEFCKEFALRTKEIFCLDTMDDEIYDFRRCWKIPYSLDIKSGYVAIPLSDKSFDNFEVDMADQGSDKYLGNIEGIKPASHFTREGEIGGINKFYEEIING